MARVRVNTTRLQIIQVAASKFLENGFTETSAKSICEELDISPGNLTFWFPTKAHLLSVLVDALCNFQRKLIEDESKEGISSVMAVCLELMTMAATCEDNPVAKDFFISAYQSPMTLKLIRENDTERSKIIYADYCKGWTDEQYISAEILVSGIEYATLMLLDENISLETRISQALDKILIIYGVPEDIRKKKIEKALSYDYKHIGERIFKEFKEYVDKTTEETFEQMLQNAKCGKSCQSPVAGYQL